MNTLCKVFIAALLCTSAYSYGDAESTRKVLASYSADNSKVLDVYDQATKSWTENDPNLTSEENKHSNGDAITFNRTVKWTYLEWDPYEGNYIEAYHFGLDDGSIWRFQWNVYERAAVDIQIGDVLEIRQLTADEYLMFAKIPLGETTFIFHSYDAKFFSSVR